jgi:hypothetical protein
VVAAAAAERAAGLLLTVQPVVLDPTKPLVIVLGNAVAVVTQ